MRAIAPPRGANGAAVLEPRDSLDELLAAVRACRACAAQLPLGPRPVLQAGADARLLVVGQAPGARVHASGVPWDDRSGERLRGWMGIDAATFYDASRIAIVPMGFCYPGRGGGGDLPPRRECAELWFERLLAGLPRIELTLLIGQYAQSALPRQRRRASLTETTRHWAHHAPRFMPLPHPAAQPAWVKSNQWFDAELVPVLRRRVRALV